MKAERWGEVGVSCCVQLAVYRWLRTVGCVQYDLWRHVYTMQGCIPEKAWKIGHVAPCVYHVGVYTPNDRVSCRQREREREGCDKGGQDTVRHSETVRTQKKRDQ